MLYRFEVGDHLVYERRTLSSLTSDTQPAPSADPASAGTTQQIEIWVLEKRGEQARILLDLIDTSADRIEPMRGVLLDIDERGRRELPEVTQTRMAGLEPALEVLPLLRVSLQDENNWRTDADQLGYTWRCTLGGPDQQMDGNTRVDYVVEPPAGLNAVALGQTGRYWFDTGTGAVTRVETLSEDSDRSRAANPGPSADPAREPGRQIRSAAILRLRERKPPAWMQRRAAEAQRYQQTLASEDRLLDDVVNRPLQIEQTIEHLSRLWAARALDFERQAGSPLEILVHARQKRLAANSELLRADAVYARRWLGRPAVPWSLELADGQPAVSERLRDGVTIECLWSVQSPWTFNVLDVLRGLQTRLAGRPVNLLCLNVDVNVQLAREVIGALSPGQTHVLAGSLLAVDRPPRLPVVRVLDRQGVIRRIWIGWQPSYTAAVDEALRLLENK